MKFKMMKAVFAGLVLTVSGLANAGLIEFIYTGTGTGSVGSTNFSDTAFTIVQRANIEDITSCRSDCIYVDAFSTSILLDNIGLFDFITGTRTFSAGNKVIGLSHSGLAGPNLFSSFVVGGFDLASNFKKASGLFSMNLWSQTPSVNTTNGLLTFNSGTANGTFEARLAGIPEPSTLAILALGFIGLCARRFKK